MRNRMPNMDQQEAGGAVSGLKKSNFALSYPRKVESGTNGKTLRPAASPRLAMQWNSIEFPWKMRSVESVHKPGVARNLASCANSSRGLLLRSQVKL